MQAYCKIIENINELLSIKLEEEKLQSDLTEPFEYHTNMQHFHNPEIMFIKY